MKISNLLYMRKFRHPKLGAIVELFSPFVNDGSAAFTVGDTGVKLRLTKATAAKLAKKLYSIRMSK